MAMTRPRLPGLLLACTLPLACKPSSSEHHGKPTKVEVVEASEAPTATQAQRDDRSATQPLAAAGLELRVPKDWVVLDEHEPNFALAHGVDPRSPHIPVCTIELRRQGPGPLPDGATKTDEGSDGFEYRRGALRSRVRSFPGPEGSSIVVHCRAPRASRQWAAVTDVFESIVETGATVELPDRRTNPKPEAIVELCTGSAARMTQVCARRGDGSVYCGATTGDKLQRIALRKPAVQISCVTRSACARAAEGALECWSGTEEPKLAVGIGAARDIRDYNIVDERGRLLRRTQDGIVELAPLGDPKLALTDVDRVLPQSSQHWGCVLRKGELWCWDDTLELPLELGDEGRPQLVAAAPGATDLRRMGDRLCLETDERWTCTDPDHETYPISVCEDRPCGCSLIGASRLSCEHEPYHPIDARPLGRISDVVVAADPCAALADGTIACRGPLAGHSGEAPGTTKAIVADLPGIAHTLELR